METMDLRIRGLKTSQKMVNVALVKKRKMEELIDMFHTIEYDSSYDYKELRHR